MKQMKTRSIQLIFIVFLSIISTACNQKTKEIICTEEFRMITIAIDGPELEDYYTLRVKTGDTIRPTQRLPKTSIQNYTVLDDNFQKSLQGKKETFIFIGIIDGKTAVQEDFVIEADACHVYKNSGAELVTLEK